MNGTFSWKWAALALILAAALSAGCTKKQTVKSGVESGAPLPDTSAIGPGAGEAPVKETPVTEAPVPAPPLMTAKEAEAARGMAVTEEKPSRFADVPFDFDQSTLREEGKRICQEVAAYLKRNPRAALLIEGHSDERGTAEYNLALGQRRATAVKNYLASLGVPVTALSTVSFGEERPLDPGHDEAAWAKNRRAHFVVK